MASTHSLAHRAGPQVAPIKTESDGGSEGKANVAGALVVANPPVRPLLAETMGFEVIVFRVGQELFSIHKQQLVACGRGMQEIANDYEAGSVVLLNDTSPSVFKLFIEWVYKEKLPKATARMQPLVQSQKLRDLCQLYSFSTNYNLEHQLCNAIMDRIQDAFLIIGKLPDVSLARTIYKSAPPESQLRKFCAASLVAHLRSPSYNNNGSLQELLKEDQEMFSDFIEAVQRFVPGADPRVRDCNGDPTCAECAEHPDHLDGKTGIWPCTFHVHDPQGDIKEENGDEYNGHEKSNGGVCYLWME
ncbi:hypothetical protein B0J14DRAFT_702117 [Halenospora varia]|nr:hypothetical protein B0J14DRAFT_702117 [Halenospora varia]